MRAWNILVVTLALGCALEERTAAPCVIDDDCAFGRVCISQACTDEPKPTPCIEDCEDPIPPVTGPCTDHSDCGFGERCVFETGMCVDAETIGSCVDDADCAPPMTICAASGRCEDGCLSDPCLVGFVCNDATGRCVDRAACEADRLEPNDASNAAAVPAAVETNLRACETDADFFGYDLAAGDTLTVELRFDEDEGRVALELVGETAPVTTAPGVASFVFTPTEDARYTARVSLEQDLGQEAGAFYDLSFQVAWASCVEDAFEDDDSAAEATTIAGRETGLNACEGDDDYFTFPAVKDDAIAVDVRFDHGEGDIDVTLFDPAGTVVAEGLSSTDDETLQHTAMTDGDYGVRVYLAAESGQRAGAAYSIEVTSTAPPRCNPDGMEPNDTQPTAALVALDTPMTLSGCPGNEDYYRFDAAAGSTLQIDATFTHAEGDLDLVLLDAAGTQLDMSASSDDDEAIVYTTTSSATLFVHVTLASDAGSVPGNTYDLTVLASGCADAFEPNDTSATAAPIPFGQHPSLGICSGEEDFYSFDLTAGQGVDIDLFFSHAEGDIDVELLTNTGQQLTQAVSGDDNEIIRFSTQVGGTYVLRVYLYADAGSQPGNNYDLDIIRR